MGAVHSHSCTQPCDFQHFSAPGLANMCEDTVSVPVVARGALVRAPWQVAELTRQVVAAGPKFDFTPAELLDLHTELMGKQSREVERAATAAATVRSRQPRIHYLHLPAPTQPRPPTPSCPFPTLEIPTYPAHMILHAFVCEHLDFHVPLCL